VGVPGGVAARGGVGALGGVSTRGGLAESHPPRHPRHRSSRP
jgi:hypothetical protein